MWRCRSKSVSGVCGKRIGRNLSDPERAAFAVSGIAAEQGDLPMPTETAATQKNLGRVHVEDVRALLEKQPGRCLDLPARVRAVREYEGVRLKKIRYEEEQPVKERRAEQTTVCLTIPGTTVLPEQNLKVTCRILEKNPLSEGIDIPQKTYTKWFDYDIIKSVCISGRVKAATGSPWTVQDTGRN